MADDVEAIEAGLREAGEHPCRDLTPFGAQLREAADLIATLRAENLEILRKWIEQAEFLKKECYGLAVDNSVLRADLAKAVEGLEAMTKHYIELAGCGDCGNWNPLDEPEVKAAQSLIKELRP